MCIYIYIYLCEYVHIYIHSRHGGRGNIYIYIYIYIHTRDYLSVHLFIFMCIDELCMQGATICYYGQTSSLKSHTSHVFRQPQTLRFEPVSWTTCQPLCNSET